jgi:site-specific recombinase XerD
MSMADWAPPAGYGMRLDSGFPEGVLAYLDQEHTATPEKIAVPIDRVLAEYLLFPKKDPQRPMDPASVHRWFKTALKRAGLPPTIKLHELRHSAADNLWRQAGNLMLAQQLLRHSSVATTQDYLHPTREDLSDALAQMQVVRSDDEDSA